MVRQAPLAVARSTRSGDAVRLSRGLVSTLRYVGLSHASLSEEEISRGGLGRYRLIVLPCGPYAPSTVVAVGDFVRRGGKLLLGLTSPPELLPLLGLRRLKTRAASVKEMVFIPKTLHGLPPRLSLPTAELGLFHAETNVKLLARWHTLEDLTIQDPAAYLAQNGALLTTAVAAPGIQALFSEDRVHWARFIAAVVNHFLPGFDLLRFQRRLTEQLSDEEEFVRGAPARDFEVRGMWLPRVPTPNECVLTARQHFNLICPELGPLPARLYERSTFHRPWLFAEPLSRCVDQAHRSGLEVFPHLTAWALPTAELARFFDGTGRLAKPALPQTSCIAHPVCSMCPSEPNNQQLLLDTVTQLLEEFGLDGVLLGGLRFPDETACQCEGCQQRFEDYLKGIVGKRILNQNQRKAVWHAWRNEIVTEVLKRLLTACRATNPNAKLAVATLPCWDQTAKAFGQDPAHWAAQQLADLFVPLDFTDDRSAFEAEIGYQAAMVGNRARVSAGLGVFCSASEIPSAAGLARQIQTVRDREADGFIVWHEHPESFRERFGDELRLGVLGSPAKLPWHPNAPVRARCDPPGQSSIKSRHRISMDWIHSGHSSDPGRGFEDSRI